MSATNAEDVVVEHGDDERRRARSPRRAPSLAQSPRLVEPAVVRRDERQAAERPRRMDLGALALVFLHRRLGLAPRLGPLAAEEQEPRQHARR